MSSPRLRLFLAPDMDLITEKEEEDPSVSPESRVKIKGWRAHLCTTMAGSIKGFLGYQTEGEKGGWSPAGVTFETLEDASAAVFGNARQDVFT